MWTAKMMAVSGAMVLAGFAAPAPIQSSPAFVTVDRLSTDEGTVKSVDTAAKSFVLTVAGKDMTIKYDDKTTYTLDGKPSTRDKALVAGNKAKVTHTGNLATTVDATTVKVP